MSLGEVFTLRRYICEVYGPRSERRHPKLQKLRVRYLEKAAAAVLQIVADAVNNLPTVLLVPWSMLNLTRFVAVEYVATGKTDPEQFRTAKVEAVLALIRRAWIKGRKTLVASIHKRST